MLHNHRFLFALLTMLLLPAAAEAQELRPYIGVGVGAFGLEIKDTGIPGTTFSQKSTVFGGFVKGGIDINDYLGAEIRLGTAASDTKNYAVGALLPGSPAFSYKLSPQYFVSYLAKLQYPVAPEFRIYGLLGATTARIKNSISVPVNAILAGGSTTKTGFSYGVGGEYNIDDQFSAGIEWMQYWTNVKVTPSGLGKMRMWGAVGTVTAHF